MWPRSITLPLKVDRNDPELIAGLHKRNKSILEAVKAKLLVQANGRRQLNEHS